MKNYTKLHKTRPETEQMDKKTPPLFKNCEVAPFVLHYYNTKVFVAYLLFAPFPDFVLQ